MTSFASRRLCCLLVAGSAASCSPSADIRPSDLRTYSVPRSVATAPQTANSVPKTPRSDPRAATGSPPLPAGRQTMAAPAGLAVKYDLPAGWTDLGAGGMRLATIKIAADAAGNGGEITIIPASGTLVGNAVRWQEQLTPGAGPELVSRAIEQAGKVSVNGVEGTIILLLDEDPDSTSPDDKSPEGRQAILAAMIPLEESLSLFVKFKGSAGLARSLREPFTEFVRSIRWK